MAGPPRFVCYTDFAGMKSILLHIGTHKTGSTSIQQFLAGASDQLQEDDLLYPEAGRPHDRAPHGHHTLAWSVQQKRGLENLEGWKEVVREIRRSPCARVLLSSEVFETCSLEEIQQIRGFFPNSEVKALVYLRKPFSYMVSMYKQHIKAWGETRSFRRFADAKMHLCDYPSLLARWRRELGEGKIIARSFEECCKPNGLEASLLDVLNIEKDQYESIMEEAGPANVSLADNETAALRCMSRLQECFRSRLLGGSGLFSDRTLLHRVKRQVVRQTQLGRSVTYLLNRSFANPLLSDTDREWFFERLREERGCPESPREIAGEPSR
jgi:hypothetical protein